MPAEGHTSQKTRVEGQSNRGAQAPQPPKPPTPPPSDQPSRGRRINRDKQEEGKAGKKKKGKSVSVDGKRPPTPPSSSSSSSSASSSHKKKKDKRKRQKRKKSSSSSSNGGKVSEKIAFAAYPTAAAKRQWSQGFRQDIVSCSKMSKRKTLTWLLAIEKRGSKLEDFAISGKGFGKLDCVIAAGLTKIFRGEIAREVSTQAEKLLNDCGTLLTGRQLAWLMNQEFVEDLKRTLPHAIADLSKLTVKSASGLEHWLTSFNSIVDLNTDLQPDFISYQAHEQLKHLDVLKTDLEAYGRLEEDDESKTHKYLLKAVKK
jgi:hypothetical protein